VRADANVPRNGYDVFAAYVIHSDVVRQWDIIVVIIIIIIINVLLLYSSF
jgi:archaeosine-15-forming tRNA-guanine transglycosylase